MKLIKKLLKMLHVCRFSKPIISRYICFNIRDIVYECKCGNRKIERIYSSFDRPFPIPTTPFITHQELNKIANEKKH